MAWPVVGVVGGGEAFAASQPTTEAGARGTTGAGLGGRSKKTRGRISTRAVGWTLYGH